METKGRPLQPGKKASKGRPKGSRNKMNQERRQFLQLHTKGLLALAMKKAIAGDMRLLTLSFGSKTLPAKLANLPMKSVDDLMASFERVARKLGAGEITMEQLSLFSACAIRAGS
jgi:hypothetical protein